MAKMNHCGNILATTFRSSCFTRCVCRNVLTCLRSKIRRRLVDSETVRGLQQYGMDKVSTIHLVGKRSSIAPSTNAGWRLLEALFLARKGGHRARNGKL